MKYSILLIPLIIFSCSSAEITLDKRSFSSVKTVAIAPFKSSIDIDAEILKEAEVSFRSIFESLGIGVVEKELFDRLLNEKGAALSEKNTETILGTARLARADAVLFGEILSHREIKKDILPHNSYIFGFGKFRENKHEIRTVTTFRYQVIVRLVNAADGSVIMTLMNRYSDTEKDDYMPGYLTMDSYRSVTLKKMGEELTEMLKNENR